MNRIKLTTMIALITLLLGACCGIAQTTKPAREISRKEFAAAFAQVKKGMTAEQVLALLGKPNDVRTRDDPDIANWTNMQAMWCYGTDHHLGFPTLGTVTIDTQNRAQYLAGTDGASSLVAKLGETKLRKLLCVLADCGDSHPLTGQTYNPRSAIVAVNALQPLGKETCVAVLHEYLDLCIDDTQGLFPVIRCLFDVPPANAAAATSSSDNDPMTVTHPGYLRPPMLGGPDWTPARPTDFPRFPVALIDDIPLLPINGYSLAGHAESLYEHLHYLNQGGHWRTTLLHPTNDPLSICEKLNAMLPKDDDSSYRHRIVARQLLRLIDTVYPAPTKLLNDPFATEDQIMSAFAEAQKNVSTLHIHWDDAAGCYVRGDGTTLPAE